jgi:hypothetical protein
MSTTTIQGIRISLGPVTITTLTAAPPLLWRVGPFRFQKGAAMPIEVTLTWEQEFDLAITPKTLGGEDAPIDGPAVWEVDGPGCTATSTGDLTALVKGVADNMGDVLITCTVDADVGEGFVALKDTCLVHVQTPMAAQLGMQASPPRQQAP